MSLLIVRDEMLGALKSAKEPLEFCSPDGMLLGYFTPVKSAKYQLEPQISDEELDRRFAAGGGRPLAEILADLEAKV